MTPNSIPSSCGLCVLVPILIIWYVHCSIGEDLERIGSGIGRYLYIERVGFDNARMGSLGPARPLCEVL